MSESQSSRLVHVLVVEDNPGDVRLIGEALKECGRGHDLTVARDGLEALDYLFKSEACGAGQHPDLIILDLNLPKKSGLDVLGKVKKDNALKHIPVVVFTSSSAPADINQAYGRNANCYVTKPADLDEYFRVIGLIESFWLTVATLPLRRDE